MNLNAQLEQLETVQLVRRVDDAESAYEFKHTLTQETVYQSLLRAKRREIHAKVARMYEEAYPDRLDEFVALLAHHCAEAGDDAKTLVYSTQAAEAAMRLYAYPEARGYFARALDAFKRLPDTEENRRRRLDIIFRYFEAAWGAFLPQELFGLAFEGETLARSLPNPDGTLCDLPRLAQVHIMLTGLYLASGDEREAIRYARQVLDEAKGFADQTLVATPSSQLGLALVSQGYFQDAQPYLVQAIALLEKTPDRWEWFDAVAGLGLTFAMRGQAAAGLAEGQRVLALMQETKNHFGITHCRSILLAVFLELADMSRLLEESERAVEVAVESDMALYASLGLGLKALAQSRLGQHTDADKSMAAAHNAGATVGGQFMFSHWIAAANAELAFHAGTWEEAIARAEQTITMEQSSGGIFAAGWSHRVWAQALGKLQPARWDQAEEHLAESLRLFEEGAARLEAARTHVEWGKVLQARGELSTAREHFDNAAKQFEASELTHELDETRRLIEALLK